MPFECSKSYLGLLNAFGQHKGADLNNFNTTRVLRSQFGSICIDLVLLGGTRVSIRVHYVLRVTNALIWVHKCNWEELN